MIALPFISAWFVMLMLGIFCSHSSWDDCSQGNLLDLGEALGMNNSQPAAVCRTCGGSPGHHVPSVLDPSGIGDPGHAMPQDSSQPSCQHFRFFANCMIFRLTDEEGGPVTGFTAEVTVKCSDCNMPFQWLGVDRGLSMASPMASADGLKLLAPITPLEEL